MTSYFKDDLEIMEGRVEGLMVSEDGVEFVLARKPVRLRRSRFTHALNEGDRVHLVLGDSMFGQRAILALHRTSDGLTEYLGPLVGWKSVLVSAAVCAIALFVQSPWLLLVAIFPLLALAYVFRSDRSRILAHLRAHLQHQPGDASSAEDTTASEPTHVPLTVRMLDNVQATTSSWTSQILEFTHDAIIIWEMDGAGILYWNRAAERLYGYSREEARGQVTHDLLQTQIEGGVSELEARLERHGIWIGNLRHTRKDGQHVEVEGRLTLMSQERRPWLVLEINRDVTDQHHAELARAEMAQQLRYLRQLAEASRP
jgi:PAS domain S-box-containing protein